MILTNLLFAAWMLFACSSLLAAETIDKPQKLSHKKLNGILDRSGLKAYYGGVMISSGDTLTGPIAVIEGALDIQDGGVLDGDVWIVNGRLILNGSARVNGRVDLVNSSEYLSRRAGVSGGVYYYSCECQLDNSRFEEEGNIVFKKYEDPKAIRTKLSFSEGEPNRVDYNLFKLGLERKNPRHKEPHVHGHAMLHVPLPRKTRGYLGFDIDFAIPLRGKRLCLIVRGFKMSFTNDNWQLSRGENSWILTTAGYDFADYYERRGGGLGLLIQPYGYIRLETVVSFQRDVSLVTRSAPSIFDSSQKKRDNPDIDEGERMAVTCNFAFDTRGENAGRQNAWLLHLWVEKGIADGPGDFSYTAFAADMRRYNRIPWGFQWDIRGKIFSSFDPIPRQITQSLNGYGGIRGLDDAPFDVNRGDRMVLLSSELRAGLPELPVFSVLFTKWDLVLFTDIGLLVEAENERSPFSFLDAPFGDWRKGAGFGISGESFLPYLGIYMAQDLDGRRKGPRIIVRAMKSF